MSAPTIAENAPERSGGFVFQHLRRVQRHSGGFGRAFPPSRLRRRPAASCKGDGDALPALVRRHRSSAAFAWFRLLEEMVGAYRPALSILTGATLLVLLVACLNSAGLLLARGVERRRTIAVRAALGASRGRLLRQLLTEGTVLSLGGGVLGLAVAAAFLRAVPALAPDDVARLDEVSIDGVAFAFTAGLSILVGLLCAAAPACHGPGFTRRTC